MGKGGSPGHEVSTRSLRMQVKAGLELFLKLVPVAALIVTVSSLYLSHKPPRQREFIIREGITVRPIDFLQAVAGDWLSDRITILWQGEEYTSVWRYNYLIGPAGKTAIRPEDFDRPLYATVAPPFIIASVQSHGQPRGVHTTWRKVSDQCWEMEPCTFNPGDGNGVTFTVVRKKGLPDVLTGEVASKKADGEPCLTIWGHIYDTRILLQRWGEQVSLPPFVAFLCFNYLYVLLCLSVVFFSGSLFLLPPRQLGGRTYVLILPLLMAFSMATSEILLTSALPPGEFTLPRQQYGSSWFVLALHALLLICIIVWSRRVVRRRPPESVAVQASQDQPAATKKAARKKKSLHTSEL